MDLFYLLKYDLVKYNLVKHNLLNYVLVNLGEKRKCSLVEKKNWQN